MKITQYLFHYLACSVFLILSGQAYAVTQPTIISPQANEMITAPASITGTASGDVESVLLGIRDQQTMLWWHNGSWGDWLLNPVSTVTDGKSGLNWSTSFNPLGTGGSGEYRAFVRARDFTGELSLAATVNFTMDPDLAAPPEASITSPQPEESVVLPVDIQGTGTADAGVQTVLVGIRDQVTRLWWNNGTWGTWVLNAADNIIPADATRTQVNWSTGFDPGNTPGSGQYRVFVKILDTSGIQSTSTALNFNATDGSTVALESTIIDPQPDARVLAPYTLTGTGTAPSGVDTVLVGIRDQASQLWWNNGSWGDWVLNPATVVTPTDSTGVRVDWRYDFDPTDSYGTDTDDTGPHQYRVFVKTRDDTGALSNSAAVDFTATVQPPVGALNIGATMTDVAFSNDNNVAYLALERGISIIDISNVDSPVMRYDWRHHINDIDAIDDAEGVALSNDGKTLFVTGGVASQREQLISIDVNDVSNPVITGIFQLSQNFSESANGLTLSVDGSKAYVVNGVWNTENGILNILDISDPTRVFVTGSVALNTDAQYVTLSHDGKTAYVSGKGGFFNTDTDEGLAIIDVSNSTSPIMTAFIDIDSVRTTKPTLSVDDRYIFVNHRIIDVSDAINPAMVSQLTVPDENGLGNIILSTDNRQAFGFFGNFWIPGFLTIFDISNINLPQVIDIITVNSRRVRGSNVAVTADKSKALVYNTNFGIQTFDFTGYR